jgi:hypothetical protein
MLVPVLPSTHTGDRIMAIRAFIAASIGLLALGAAAPTARAADDGESTIHFEASYAYPELGSSGVTATPRTIALRAGYDFSRYFALEAMGVFGIGEETADILGYPVQLGVDNGYGAFVKGQLPVAPHFELFATGGWFHATLKATLFGTTTKASDSSVAYGAGFRIPFNEQWYVEGDYMSYYSKDGDSVRGPSVGVGVRF